MRCPVIIDLPGGSDFRLRHHNISDLLPNLADLLITVYAFLFGILIERLHFYKLWDGHGESLG